MKSILLTLFSLIFIGCAHKHHDHSGGGCEHKCECSHKKGKAHSCEAHDEKGHKCEHHKEGEACSCKKHKCGGDHKSGMHPHHDFKDAEKWAKKFNDPKRAEWQKPEEVVKLMSLDSGQSVADIGAGTGYMIPFLSSSVGSQGKVYGLDVEVTLVEFMNGYIARKNLKNAEARFISKTDPGLLSLNVDKVLLVNTWHHIENRIAYGKRLFSQMKKQAEVYIVEFDYKKEDFGPPIEMRLKPSQLKKEMTSVGFSCSKLSESLPRQYVIRCEKG